MTQIQRQALEFIGTFITTTGISPSYEEIAEGIGLARTAKSDVFRLVSALVERGYLVREGRTGARRALRLTTEGERSLPQVALAAVPTAALYAELQRRRATERPHG